MGQQLGSRGHTSVPLLMPERLSSGTTGSAAPPPSLPRLITACACTNFKALHLRKLLLEPQFQGSTGRLRTHPCNCFAPALSASLSHDRPRPPQHLGVGRQFLKRTRAAWTSGLCNRGRSWSHPVVCGHHLDVAVLPIDHSYFRLF